MSKIKQLLGLDETSISDPEIIKKLVEAQKKDLDEVDFATEDGSIVRIFLPHLKFDEFMYRGG